MKAKPLPIQFSHPAHNTWEYKHEFRYETLHQVFVEYQKRIGVTKPIP